jgi:quercetin dioxygenase-like cupin family protein
MTATHFRLATEIPWFPIPFGKLRQVVMPADTGSRQLVLLEGVIRPGEGHDFHMHPQQEEVIYVVSGQIEQWIGKDKRVLGPGDAVHVPPTTVHGAFNTGTTEARLLAIFGPVIGDGFDTVDMAAESPWKDLRRA